MTSASVRNGAGGLLVAVAATLLLLASPAAAQETGAIRGQVTESTTGEPVEGAQVFLAGRDRGTLTNAEGRFTIRGVRVGPAEVRVQRIGYASRSRTVRVRAGQTATVNFRIRSSAVNLEGIVVTGTAGEQQKREIGNVVSTFSVTDPVEKGGVTSMNELIKARVPNVKVRTSSGQVGAGADVDIRGTSSFALSGFPLIYVDGVRVDNELDYGEASQGFGAGLTSGFDDLDPSQIESIEIIKGAAAATLYGSEASAGVVQITTKEGVEGETRWTVRTNQGWNWFRDAAERIKPNWGTDPETGEPFSVNLIEREQRNGRQVFLTGRIQNYQGNVRGGGDSFRFYVGGNVDLQDGVQPTNEMRRVSGRANFDVDPGEHWRVDINSGVTQTNRMFSETGGEAGVLFNTLYGLPSLLDTPNRGFLLGPPEFTHAKEQFPTNTDKVTYSVNAQYTPAEWLRSSVTIGQDNTFARSAQVTERLTDPFFENFASQDFLQGSKSQTERDRLVTTFDWDATISTPLPFAEPIRSEFSVGAQYIRRLTKLTQISGRNFPAAGIDVLEAAAVIDDAGDSRIEDNTLGGYIQDRLSFRNRLFLTGGVRIDDNSSLGEATDPQVYPKVNASWVVSEESFFGIDVVDQLRLRAAYGEAGRQPDVFSALRTFEAITSGAGNTALTPQEIGNAELEPERTREIEAGFEGSMFEDRLSVSGTYFHSETEEALLAKDLSPSAGFPGAQFVNAGQITNEGVEGQVTGIPIDSEPVTVNLSIQGAWTDNRVDDLGGADRGTGFITNGLIRHAPGLPVSAWFEQRVLSAEVNDSGEAVNAMCDGGDPDGLTLPDGTPLEPGGPPVPCSEAPEVFLGQSTPTFTGSVTGNITVFNHITIRALFDWETGSKKWDNNTRIRCQIFEVCRGNFFPNEIDPALLAQFQSPGNLRSFTINEDDFARLRELSVTANIPSRLLQGFGIPAQSAQFTLTGRNLFDPITNWTGLDPETEFASDRSFNFIEQSTMPPLTSITGAFRISF